MNRDPGSAPGEVTLLLRQWKEGDPTAFERLLPVAYPQLHSLAQRFLSQERPGHTLQATALVNELYMKLVHQNRIDLSNRQQFFALAARIMRSILIDHARASKAQKRGGEHAHVPLTDELPWLTSEPARLLDLDRALSELSELDSKKVSLVELRFFLGLTAEEVAETSGISKATVDRELRFVRSWLYDRLGGGGSGNNPPARASV